MAKIRKDMTIAQVLERDVNTAQVFFSMGMHCVGCPSSSGESLEKRRRYTVLTWTFW